MNEDRRTIAAISTPPGMGAISLIRMSGPDAAGIAETVFRGKARSSWIPRRQEYGRVVNSEGDLVDDVLLTWFPGPASFTGEDVVEIACHGGILVTQRVLSAVLAAGVEPARPGEFSQRAFLNGKLDLTQAEAVMDLISAQTELAARAAREQLEGNLGRELEGIRQAIISLSAHVEAYIDFPDEDIDPDSSDALMTRLREIQGRVDRLLATADQGRILREGLRMVIAGPPNAGKSSLLNLLLGFDRAIVTPTAGTTRDTIEETINLRGIPVRLVDTAGIRKAAEAIESEGVARSLIQMKRAEVILLVVDSSESSQPVAEVDLPEDCRIVRILNKHDLPSHPDWEGVEGIRVSCLDPAGADILRNQLYEVLVQVGSIDTASLAAINARHQRCLEKARAYLKAAAQNLAGGESPEFIAMDLRASLDAVGDVIGKTDIEEILGEIFSTFCIGK